MKKDQIVILEDRGLISISGKDAREYLQNIITNDINKVSEDSSIFSALFNPQGKYLFEFFIMKSKNGYFLAIRRANVLKFLPWPNIPCIITHVLRLLSLLYIFSSP